MSGSYLLDTNAVIALLLGQSKLGDILAGAGEVFISATVLGELYYGCENSAKKEHNIAEIDDFADTVSTLTCDEDTAREYGQIKAVLRKLGKLIPENDIWIAAAAKQFDLTILTQDKHFYSVPGLKLKDW